MALVINDVIKMEWDSKNWLQTSAKNGRKPVFIVAGKEYPSDSHGEVTVFFTSKTAFIFESEEGLWNCEEFFPVAKQNFGNRFPYVFQEYIPVIAMGDDACDLGVLEDYGLLEYKDDIEARLRDVAPYGEEKEFIPQ